MALIVEDGTIVSGAVSYVTEATASSYHTERNNSGWVGTVEEKEAALIRAAMYLDGHYRLRWKGQKVSPLTQPMEWPRAGVRVVDYTIYYDVPPSYYDSEYSGFLSTTEIPDRVKDAQCELALIALTADLQPPGATNILREKVDVLETEYVPGTRKGNVAYPLIDQLLSDYLKSVGSVDVLRG